MQVLIVMFYALPVWMLESLLQLISDLWGLGWDFYDCALYAKCILWVIIISLVMGIIL